MPQGIGHQSRLKDILDEPNSELPELVREVGRILLEQIAGKNAAILSMDQKIRHLAAQSDDARRLQTIPGVGPVTALAVEAFAPSLQAFRCGRNFAAWLGLVPKQHSSGGKHRLGRNRPDWTAFRLAGAEV